MVSRSLGIALLLLVGFCLAFSGSRGAQLPAGNLYNQPISASGGLLQSSWWDPNGSDYDQYAWDAFTLQATLPITAVHWSGGYDPTHFGMGGPVVDFTVDFCATVAGIQPDVINPPLASYQVGGNAGETLAGSFGGITMYDYSFTLPTAFTATAGTKYWVQIEAWQHGIPDWGLALGSGGEGTHFQRTAGIVGDIHYAIVPGDTTFGLGGPLALDNRLFLPLIAR